MRERALATGVSVGAHVVLWGGLDPGGQAGLAADLQAVARQGAVARLVLTARTAQADGRWLGAWPVDATELRTVLAGLALPQRFAVKAGMLATLEIAREFQAFCTKHGVRPVVDPMHRSTSGASMWPGQDEAEVRAFLLQEVLPHAGVVTPNWPELEWLSGKVLPDLASALAALQDLPCPGVLKGGHAPEPWRGIDHVWDGATLTALHPHGSTVAWRGQARGTGCRFATDLAITLVSHDGSLAQAARHAKLAVHALLHRDLGDQGL